jgi:hypothetical protein
MTVALMGWMWRLRAGWDEYPALGSFRQDPQALRPARRKAVKQSEEDRAEVRTGSRNRRKSVDAVCVTAGRHDRHFCVGCVHATLRFLTTPGNGITVSTPGIAVGEAVPGAHSKVNHLLLLSSRRKPGPRLDTGVIAESLGPGFRRGDRNHERLRRNDKLIERNFPHAFASSSALTTIFSILSIG